jgi:hypothetical protein
MLSNSSWYAFFLCSTSLLFLKSVISGLGGAALFRSLRRRYTLLRRIRRSSCCDSRDEIWSLAESCDGGAGSAFCVEVVEALEGERGEGEMGTGERMRAMPSGASLMGLGIGTGD